MLGRGGGGGLGEAGGAGAWREGGGASQPVAVAKPAARLADSGSFVLVRSAEVRWRCSPSGGPRERADDNARVRRGPGGSVADRPEARAKTRADDARVTAFELLGDRPRAAGGPGRRRAGSFGGGRSRRPASLPGEERTRRKPPKSQTASRGWLGRP